MTRHKHLYKIQNAGSEFHVQIFLNTYKGLPRCWYKTDSKQLCTFVRYKSEQDAEDFGKAEVDRLDKQKGIGKYHPNPEGE